MPLLETKSVPVRAPRSPSADDMFLPVPFVSQRPYKNLSWAACGLMILNYNNVGANLSSLATKLLEMDCSDMPPASQKPVPPLDMYKAYGFAFQILEAPLSPQSVRACMANTQPVQAEIQWRDGSSQSILIVGSYANGDLLVHDPLRGTGRQTYRAIYYAYNRGAWLRTLYDFRRASYVPRA